MGHQVSHCLNSRVRPIWRVAAMILLTTQFFAAHAQALKIMEELEIKHIACLNSGVDQLGCAQQYIIQMDSMLNIAYRSLRVTMNDAGKAVLKKEQLGWLKKRDAYFSKQDKIYQKKKRTQEWGPAMYFMPFNEDAYFVRERAINLLKRVK